MRASTTLLTLALLLAATAAEAETRPDYSPAGLMRLFAGQPLDTRRDDPLRFSYGVIDYRYMATRICSSRRRCCRYRERSSGPRRSGLIRFR
jgi:hypothetical protein